MRICVFGDSFVNGTEDDECLGWVGRLCAAERRRGADVTVYNLGVRRETSADIRARWRREAEIRLAGCEEGRLVFSFGVNDCVEHEAAAGPHVPLADALDNTREILREAAGWLPVLMIGPLPVTEDARRNAQIETLSAAMAALCAELAVPFHSTVAFARDMSGIWRAEAMRGDGIHPNAASYAALAEAIQGWGAWRAWFAADGGAGR